MNTKSLTLSLIASAAFTCFSMAPALAQNTNTSGIDRTQQEIHARIQQGIASGRITQQEAQVLYQREREIQFREIRMKRDGMATLQERHQLRLDLEDMRAEVEAKIANRQTTANQYRSTPGIDNGPQVIRSRIERGLQTGNISPREANILFAKERQLDRHEAAFKADGYLSRAEREQLRDEVAMLNNDIDKMMANRRYN
jgi:hypothetical protein